jgi:hypothetical protein
MLSTRCPRPRPAKLRRRRRTLLPLPRSRLLRTQLLHRNRLRASGIANQVTVAAIINGLIFMAIGMVLVRTIALGVPASRLPAAELVRQDA